MNTAANLRPPTTDSPLSIVQIDLASELDPAPASPPPPPASSASASAAAPAVKRAYPAPADIPTQEGPRGLRYDFNDGCRVLIPEGEHPWRVRLSDLDTGNILFETELKAGRINSTKRYFIRFRLEVWQNGEALFAHDYSAAGRDVLVQFPVGTLGDPMGWFPYAVKFKELHGCKLTCAMADKVIPLFRDAYPDITFLTHEEVKPEKYYATYSIGLFFDDKDFVHQPCDFRHVGLHRTAGYILGVDPDRGRAPARISTTSTRPIAEPYVCIAAQSTTQSKYWNNPTGWREIVRVPQGRRLPRRLHRPEADPRPRPGLEPHPARGRGRDRRPDRWSSGRGGCKHCDFFIGLSSGLSWLAWAAGMPGGDDHRLHPSDQRIRHAVPGDQLSRLQRLLERRAPPLRPQGLPVVPAPRRTRRASSNAPG